VHRDVKANLDRFCGGGEPLLDASLVLGGDVDHGALPDRVRPHRQAGGDVYGPVDCDETLLAARRREHHVEAVSKPIRDRPLPYPCFRIAEATHDGSK